MRSWFSLQVLYPAVMQASCAPKWYRSLAWVGADVGRVEATGGILSRNWTDAEYASIGAVGMGRLKTEQSEQRGRVSMFQGCWGSVENNPLTRGNIPSTVLGLHCEEGRSPEHGLQYLAAGVLAGYEIQRLVGKKMSLGAKKGWLFESLVSNFKRYTWTWDWNPSRWLHQKRQAVCLWGSPGFGQKVSNVACMARAGSTIPMVQHHLAAGGLCHKGACLPWQCHWWRWEAQKMGRWRNCTSVKI